MLVREDRPAAAQDHALFGALRLSGVRHLDAGARAADLLVQLAARMLPALPRPGLPARDRSRADRPRPHALHLAGRARAVDQGRVDVPPEAAGGRGRDERDRHRHPLAGPVAGRAGTPPGRHRRRAPHGHLPQPLRPAPGLHGAVRRHAPKPGAPLREHGLRQHPRADRGADGPPALPGVRGRTSAAGEPGGDRGRPQHLRVHAPFRARRPGVDRGARADRDRAGDRSTGGARDRRAPALPGQRRDRLPVARACRGDPVGRRGAADPPRDADRLLARRRPVHPRRALDRAPSARQRQADRHPPAPPGPRQHGDRRRARRGHDPGRRPRRRPGSGGRRARRRGRGGGNGGADRASPGVAHRPVPEWQAPDPPAGPAPESEGRAGDPQGATAQPQGDRRRRSRSGCSVA